jgi:hypothetical protein
MKYVKDFVKICIQILFCNCDKYEIWLSYEELDQLSLLEDKKIQFFLLKINKCYIHGTVHREI